MLWMAGRRAENCAYEEGRRIALKNGGSIFPGVSQRNPDGDMYLVGESCIYLADGNISQESSLWARLLDTIYIPMIVRQLMD